MAGQSHDYFLIINVKAWNISMLSRPTAADKKTAGSDIKSGKTENIKENYAAQKPSFLKGIKA